MIPGLGGGMDPRQAAMMMKKFGIDVRDIPGVQEVVIRTADKDYVFSDASVSVMKAQGVETWQVSGTPKTVRHEVELKATPEDIELVASQTGKTQAQAKAALEACGGDLAQAILKLSGG